MYRWKNIKRVLEAAFAPVGAHTGYAETSTDGDGAFLFRVSTTGHAYESWQTRKGIEAIRDVCNAILAYADDMEPTSPGDQQTYTIQQPATPAEDRLYAAMMNPGEPAVEASAVTDRGVRADWGENEEDHRAGGA